MEQAGWRNWVSNRDEPGCSWLMYAGYTKNAIWFVARTSRPDDSSCGAVPRQFP